MRKTQFVIVLLLVSFSFVSYVFADITLEGITVNLDKVTWNFPNSITLSNIFVQDNGVTLKLDDTSEERKYNFFRSGSLTSYDISLVGFTSEKIDFTVNSLGSIKSYLLLIKSSGEPRNATDLLLNIKLQYLSMLSAKHFVIASFFEKNDQQ